MKYWKRMAASLFLVFGVSFGTLAQEPSPLDAYQEYAAAIEAGDLDAAYAASKRAYDLAQAQWGDTRPETGLLASNYAFMSTQKKNYEDALEAYGVCEAVLLKYLPDTIYDASNCQLQAGYLHLLLEQEKKAELAFRRTLETVGEVPADDGDLALTAGEASLALARLYYPDKIKLDNIDDDYSEKLELTREYAEAALDLLKQAHGDEHADVAMAHFFIGLYHEAQKANEAAAFAYEKAYYIRLELLGKDNDLTRQAFGRMMFNGGSQPSLDSKESKIQYVDGNCVGRKQDDEVITVCTKRKPPPEYPNKASARGRFGYVQIQYDIGTDGKPVNIRVYTSWPDDFFDDAAKKAVRKWRFSEPVNQQGEARVVRDVVAFFRFELRN